VHSRFAGLDAELFPGLAEPGWHILSPVLDERFAYGLTVLLDGLTRHSTNRF
jgi:hypothetical protein